MATSTLNSATDEVAIDTIDGILKFSSLREDAKLELRELLESARGRKVLVVDDQLSGLLSQIVPDSKEFYSSSSVYAVVDLQSADIQLNAETQREVPENVIFLTRPHLPNMRLIATQILHMSRSGGRSQFKVCFVPSQSLVCMHLLEEHVDVPDLLPRISYMEYKIGFIPYDTDLLSMEMNTIFKQCYIDGDLTCLNTVAQALHKFQKDFGVISNIKCKGSGSKKVVQKLLHKRVEDSLATKDGGYLNQSEDSYSRSPIDTLIILDRETDLISPLITPLTYEGLVDDTLGIENSKIIVDSSILGAEEVELGRGPVARATNPGESVIMNLTNNDSIFAEIRNLSIERLGSYMQEKAIHIRERYAAFKGNRDASLAEIHEFVKKIPKLTKDFKSLNQHIHIAEKLKQRTDGRDFRDQWQMERGLLEGESYVDQLEELLQTDTDRSKFYTILRLLCLQSQTAWGIRSNRYDAIRRTIVQVYGFHHVYTLVNLERCGLLKRKDMLLVVETTSPWQTLRKLLRLIDEHVNMIAPDDITYIAAGYGPLLVRLIQQLLTSNPQNNLGLAEALKLTPGPFIEFSQGAKAEELSEILARQSIEVTASGLQPIKALTSMTTDMSASLGIRSINRNDDSRAMISNSLLEEPSNLKKIAMVMVIGGISYLEISALRFLSNDPAFPYRFVIAATKVINGKTFLKSLEHVA
jgi:hypothetical protein